VNEVPPGFSPVGAWATELSQCPYDVGTPMWRTWQHGFAQAQSTNDRERGFAEAQGRFDALGWKPHVVYHYEPNALENCKPARTEKQREYELLMRELEYGPIVEFHGPRTRIAASDITSDLLSPNAVDPWVSWNGQSGRISIAMDIVDPVSFNMLFGSTGVEITRWAAAQPRRSGRRKGPWKRPQAKCHHGNQKGACKRCWR
jgi:hypothetical protein